MDIQIDASQLLLTANGLRQIKRQMPYIMALTATRCAQKAQVAVKKEMTQVFDRPTPWTLNATYVKMATKQSLTAILALREWGGGRPIKYLGPEVLGGMRHTKAFELRLQSAGIVPRGMALVPATGAKLDQYGNISRGMIGALLSQLKAQRDASQNETAKSISRKRKTALPSARYFVVHQQHGGLSPGVYARYSFAHGGAVKPMFRFVRTPSYKARFALWPTAMAEVERVAPEEFAAAFTHAMATPKP
jgi:hypothetical protein